MLFTKRSALRLMGVLAAVTAALAITETWARLYIGGDSFELHEDERNLTYRYDQTLGWFPIENSKKTYQGSRLITVENNQRGFRDGEHVLDGRPRIIFLGDSAVWGYDVEQTERFTERLREKLPDWAVYNLGVSGYGTDQDYLLLEQQYDYYAPNIVFLLTGNDEKDDAHNCVYGGYYKPYFVAHGDELELRGVPVPKSENYFFVRHKILARLYLFRLLARKYFDRVDPPVLEQPPPTHAIITNMKKFVEAKGSRLLIGLVKTNQPLEAFLAEAKIPYVNLENPHRYPENGTHWTPSGHALVSERIFRFLTDRGYLEIGYKK